MAATGTSRVPGSGDTTLIGVGRLNARAVASRPPARWWLHPRRLLACAFGLGLSPWAPGTCGTLLGVALYFPMAALPLPGYLAALAALSVLGVWVCGRTAAELARISHSPPAADADHKAVTGRPGALATKDGKKCGLGHHDPAAIVWDEVVGFLATMTAAPAGGAWVLAGFVLFRFFDIVKPWPVRAAERVRGGLGILLDDLVAGILSLVVLQIAALVIGRLA